jgi:hypothetical protein
MSAAREGLYATLYLADSAGTVGPGSIIALLTGVDLNWAQTKRRFYSLGSLIPEKVLDGVIQWNGSFKRAYFNNAYAGSVNIGTCRFIGSICPRGTAQPAVMGTFALTGGNLSNMAAENEAATTEEESFILYNVSVFG